MSDHRSALGVVGTFIGGVHTIIRSLAEVAISELEFPRPHAIGRRCVVATESSKSKISESSVISGLEITIGKTYVRGREMSSGIRPRTICETPRSLSKKKAGKPSINDGRRRS